ncbi:hypothetical protein TSAR_004751 [Trichomalopsis sarcophagae]|uniref:Uncharacterized protein n=1 Tax=Trichomalopsis sarcophagae TaxID=543379 RepID=A0A232FKI8_9HYME|nr:hypothetical protein TSAR_004751 [Trichomalopsis sarcophagae]
MTHETIDKETGPSNYGSKSAAKRHPCYQYESGWNIDFQELEYNPSKKDLTDAKIHHLLAEELCKPYKRHRRLSYSRHAVNDKDLSTQVNYRMHMNIRRTGEHKHRSKRSKRIMKMGCSPTQDRLTDSLVNVALLLDGLSALTVASSMPSSRWETKSLRDTGSLPFWDPYRSICTIKGYLHKFFGGRSPD